MANVVVKFFPQSSDGFYASNNRFQINGTKGYSESKTLPNNQLFARVDLPGVSKEAIRYSTDKKMVFFQGEAPQLSPYEEGTRSFLGGVGVICNCCELTGFKSDLRDGVLRMILQKVSVKPRRQGTSPCSANNGFIGEVEDNPFVKKGSKKGFEAIPTKEGGLFLRIDMPGVSKQDSRVWMVNGEVRFLGRARKIIDHDQNGHDYIGGISLFPNGDHVNCSNKKSIQEGSLLHEIKDGVLRILINPPA